ncbi:MAG TPA: SRPBCC family protein [Acidimicrobiales bacterium]|nr:SRPBCC family protein [Acidimicrobiales bacterium]
MPDDSVSATLVIAASAGVVFSILADPARHAAIDGTGWVCEALEGEPVTAAGQVFRMAMYHPNHPDGSYRMANLVEIFDPPSSIAWRPGTEDDAGDLSFGGWIWRYDLTPLGPSETRVTLSYDWSAVPEDVRRHIGFPPFAPDHLDNSLNHLAELANP